MSGRGEGAGGLEEDSGVGLREGGCGGTGQVHWASGKKQLCVCKDPECGWIVWPGDK